MSKAKPRWRRTHATIGTLGHVDHGKTSLTAAITTVLARAGGARAMTYEEINPSSINKEGWVTIHGPEIEYMSEERHYRHIDLPHHADYIKNMITGTADMDGAILVVSAADGLMPQTREHVFLARQVGIPSLVVFLNKADRVNSPEQLAKVEWEVRELLSKYGFPGEDTPVIVGSAALTLAGNTGEYGEQSIHKLLAAADNFIPTPTRPKDLPFLMQIEDVSTSPGRGTVATGRVECGQLKMSEQGEPLEIVGLKATTNTVATSIEMFRKTLNYVEAGDPIAISLRDTDPTAIERGQVTATPGSIQSYTAFMAEIYILSAEEGGRNKLLLSGCRPQFYFRHTDVKGKLTLPEGIEMVMPGDNVSIQAELLLPIAMHRGLRFLIREEGQIVGAGIVTETLDAGLERQ